MVEGPYELWETADRVGKQRERWGGVEDFKCGCGHEILIATVSVVSGQAAETPCASRSELR